MVYIKQLMEAFLLEIVIMEFLIHILLLLPYHQIIK